MYAGALRTSNGAQDDSQGPSAPQCECRALAPVWLSINSLWCWCCAKGANACVYRAKHGPRTTRRPYLQLTLHSFGSPFTLAFYLLRSTHNTPTHFHTTYTSFSSTASLDFARSCHGRPLHLVTPPPPTQSFLWSSRLRARSPLVFFLEVFSSHLRLGVASSSCAINLREEIGKPQWTQR